MAWEEKKKDKRRAAVGGKSYMLRSYIRGDSPNTCRAIGPDDTVNYLGKGKKNQKNQKGWVHGAQAAAGMLCRNLSGSEIIFRL